jgi:glycosyltransferase involved in cell wall biosynthesis
MRILHLAKYYWPRSGGMERVVQSLAEGAANLGHQVEVVAVETIGRAGSPSRQRSGVTKAFSLAALGSQEIAPGYIAAAWRAADIIHVHHPHPGRRRLPAPGAAHAGGRDPARRLGRAITGRARLVLRRARRSWCRAGAPGAYRADRQSRWR